MANTSVVKSTKDEKSTSKKESEELSNAIQAVSDLAIFYEKQGKKQLAGFALNAKRELFGALHMERITK